MNSAPNLFRCACVLAAILSAGTVRAAEKEPDLLDALHADRAITDSQYAQLKQAQRKEAERARRPAIDGYIQFDAPLSVTHDDVLGSRTNLRRFYVRLRDTIAPGWRYSTTFGYFNGATYFVHGTVTYTGFKRLAVTGGYFKEPFSLSYLTSPANLLLPERPLPVMALDPGKHIGAALTTHGERWTLSGGLFGGNYKQTAAAPQGAAGRWGASVRGTLTPWYSHDGFWEIGASIARRRADTDHTVAFGYLPESFTIGTKLAATPAITGVSHFSRLGVETLVHAGAFAVQGEYLQARVVRPGAATLRLPGWYAQASWSLTGEQRAFSPAKGVLGGLVPAHPVSAGGRGAWEIAARYSALDLNDAALRGGSERNVTLGVNWYPERPLKIMLDAIRVLPVHGGSHAGVSTTIVMLRLQAAY